MLARPFLLGREGGADMSEPLVVNANLVLPADEVRWSAVRSSGPGGQNVNKVSSRVELRFDIRASKVLSAAAKARLAQLAGGRVTSDGVLIVVCQQTRDQHRNLELARERLAELVRRSLVPPKRRRATRPTRGARERRLGEKKLLGEKKRRRASTSKDDG